MRELPCVVPFVAMVVLSAIIVIMPVYSLVCDTFWRSEVTCANKRSVVNVLINSSEKIVSNKRVSCMMSNG